MWDDNAVDFSVLLGKVLLEVHVKGNEEIIFTCSDGGQYRMYHDQDCCESVTIEDISGDLKLLVGEPILLAEVVTSSDNPPPDKYDCDSHTWTFYKLASNQGYATIRWYGESNGYYSEEVTFEQVVDGN